MNPIYSGKNVNIETQKMIFPNFKSLRSKINVLTSSNIKLFFKNESFFDFILKLQHLVLSYTDVTQNGFRLLTKKIKVIFPISEKKEWESFYGFKNEIKNKFDFVNDREDALKLLRELESIASIFSPAPHLREVFEDSDILVDPQEKGYSAERYAYSLQLTLNAMLVEFDLLKKIERKVEELCEVKLKNQLIDRGKYPLLEKGVSAAYKVPNQILSEPFYKKLQSNSVIDLHEYKGEIYISCKKNKSSYPQNKIEINRLITKNTNEELALSLKSIEACMDLNALYWKEVDKEDSEKTLIGLSAIENLIEKNFIDDNFSYYMVPALLEFHNYMKNHELIELNKHKRLLATETVLFQICQTFPSILEAQSQLFYYAQGELQRLVDQDPGLAIYQRDLTKKKNVSLRELYDPSISIPCDKSVENKVLKSVKPKIQKPKKTIQVDKENIAPNIQNLNHTVKKVKKIEEKVVKPISPEDQLLLQSPFAIKAPLEKKAEVKIENFPGRIFPYTRDPRVLRWDRHPVNTPLPFEGYSNLSLKKQRIQHIFHAPPFVDRFMDLGIVHQWQSPTGDNVDKCISILARITFNQKVYSGAVNYTLNLKQMICYHRGFSENLDPGLRTLFNEKIAGFKKDESPKIFHSGNSILTVDGAGNVEINDQERGLKIELFV